MFWRSPSPNQISARLADRVDAAALSSARARAEQRPIEDVFASGEAELVALMQGLKPLVRQLLSQAELDGVRTRGLPPGVVLEVGPVLRGRNAVFISRDPACAKRAVQAERAQDNDALGSLLGYPRCCIDAFHSVREGKFRKRTNLKLFTAAARRTAGPWEPRLNNLDQGMFHYLPWRPCSFDCAPSHAYVDAVAGVLSQSHGGWLSARNTCSGECRHQTFVSAIDEALSAHRLVLVEEVQVSMRGEWKGNELQVTEAWPTFRDRPGAATTPPDQRDAAIHLAAAITLAGRVELNDGTLLLAGKKALKCNGALFAPFGNLRAR